ncbi:hypothetical protein [Mucilaginibacter sp. L3T2-6]|uniref:LIC_13387 family protein n=1 Tax=Mucilaginibacter sp. L3T2-6 TaxID=3062491 RepID=UPI0026759ABD|nr:hypothetical protein [Mucilaginibacter sp. L3T2-6]MDO3642454.1 hypothetical protein [Mucilaginibacter sp. L3T2-6]MDV6214949.1 hypothetical protein [Mucilaginibacter sp. L3T2-6]
MKPKIFIRISSALMLLHTAGHTIGALTWKQAPDSTVARLISDMQSIHFAFMGRQVSLGSFFQGYGVINIFVLLFITVLLWLLSNAVGNTLTGKLLPVVAIFLLLMGVSELIYFFPFAAAISLLAGMLALAASINLKTATAS